jgi:Protein of unknown function (DUF3106)
MKLRTQFGGWLLAIVSCGVVWSPCYAQHPRFSAAHPQARQDRPQPRPKQNANRPPARQNRPAGKPQAQARAEAPPPRPNGNNGASGNPRTPGTATPRQQLGVGSPRPWVDRMRDLTPAQREQVMQNSAAFRNLSPEQQSRIRDQFDQWDRKTPIQKADQRDREAVWRNLTQEQRDHIKNDVLPAWRQLPPERRQAISQRLSVLKNMPESAKNERLNDPKFTAGMNDEDKATLRDLSHLHVGGPPDPPGE